MIGKENFLLNLVKLVVGDKKTKIPRMLVIAGIAAIFSKWWQPYFHIAAERLFGIDENIIASNEREIFISGWLLVLIGVALFIFIIKYDNRPGKDELAIREIGDFLVNDLHSSWDVFADQLDITDLIRENHKKLNPEAQKKGFSAYMSHINSLEMKKRTFMNDLQKLRLKKEKLVDERIASDIHHYWEKGIHLCNDCLKEKEDRQESRSSCSASFEALNKNLSDKIKNL